MAECKNCPSGPNNSYLISFGDTMTALLAFFIILNTLAEEQTGANLHAGTGSFMDTVDKFGLAGKGQQRSVGSGVSASGGGPEIHRPGPGGRTCRTGSQWSR
jgi:hypothetical protein